MKKAKHRLVLIITVAIIILILITNISVTVYSDYKSQKYEGTVLPKNLTAEETIHQLIEYWNDGNQKGVNLICSKNFDISKYKHGEAYSFYEDKIRPEVVIEKLVVQTEFGINQYIDSQYSDRHYFMINYNSDDIESDWRSNGFGIFLVARETPDGPYKICGVFTGW